MKANIPRAYETLPQKEKQRLHEFFVETVNKVANEQIDKEEVKVQKIWIQYACIVLHNAFGFDKDQCMMFIANWKSIYRQNGRMKCEEDQKAFLEKELSFFNGEYPFDFVDSMERC